MKQFTLSTALVRSASVIAVAASLAVPTLASAQDVDPNAAEVSQDPADEEIVVVGVRGSIQRAIDIKRNSAGVVDAISAEDIGKFPDTNLAESLQRITGVSISRVNGEGSQVAVRGFSGGFNLVTINGRQLPASNVDTSAGNAFARGTGRSFDFQNLASEGVSALEVYKTGRASVPSGGIGAAINIVTRKPLDSRESGFSGSVGAKALYDVSMSDAENDRSHITPEFSGLLNWTNPDATFGATLFGSYQLRNSSSVQANPNYWNIVPLAEFLNSGTYVNANTVVENAPTTSFVQIPNDSRYQFSENRRERINAQGVLQFRPSDTLDLSIDALYARNTLEEDRSEQTNWFQRPFGRIRFDNDPQMQSAIFLQEAIQADKGYEQQRFSTKTELYSIGGNAKWEFADNLSLFVDGYHSKSVSNPNNPNGTSATLVAIGAPVRSSHSLTYVDGFPQQAETINDCTNRGGNCNNVLDLADLGSQVGRTVTSRQEQRINGATARLAWDFGDGSRFDFGGQYIDSKMRSTTQQTTQTLGDWGITDTGLINQIAGDLVDTYCLTCKFDAFNPGSTGSALIAFRGNAVDLNNVLSPYYAQRGKPVGPNPPSDDTVAEKTWAIFGQMTWNGEIAGRRAQAVIGARYEQTDVRSVGIQAIPSAIRWAADNDFFVDAGAAGDEVVGTGSYENLLPALDFNIDIVENLVGRVSFSQTIARADYGNLFATATAGAPPRPTATGGVPTGSAQNPGLLPLLSNNFDVSLEWYYQPSSFVSVGFFDKRVRNFIGTGVTNRNLFGLRDPGSGAAGSRSGTALAFLRANNYDVSDINLFSYTALLVQNNGNQAAATAAFNANYANGALNDAFVNTLLAQVDIVADPNDPLFNFAVSQPINNREGRINGFEVAWTHFFGSSGFGFAASYTKVNGDVNVDPYANPNENVFALTGLGDSANITGIYDKGGLSARISYNWRDKFLSATNQGANRNPLFTAAFGTLDANISYDISENFAVSLEAINLTSESLRQYARTETNLVFAQELKPRILAGARFRF
jgi:TonB-dependent receptor